MPTFTHRVATPDHLSKVVAKYRDSGYRATHHDDTSVLLVKANSVAPICAAAAGLFTVLSFAFDGGLFGGTVVGLWKELRGAIALVGFLILIALSATTANLSRPTVLVAIGHERTERF